MSHYRTFEDTARQYPPVLCRLLAIDDKGKPMSMFKIADNGPLSLFEVQVVERLTTWDNVDFGVMLRFIRGCNLNFSDNIAMRRIDRYVRRQATQLSPWRRLRGTPEWLPYYEPLLKLYAASLR
jgi:hypothetical protein